MVEGVGVRQATVAGDTPGFIEVADMDPGSRLIAVEQFDTGVPSDLTSEFTVVPAVDAVVTLTVTDGDTADDSFHLTFNGHESAKAVGFPVNKEAVFDALLSIQDFADNHDDIGVEDCDAAGKFDITFSRDLGGQVIGAITVTTTTGDAAASCADKVVGSPAGIDNTGGTDTSGNTLIVTWDDRQF